MIAVKMLPARNGDALLITADDGTHRGAMLIDGGYASTFGESIRPELESLSQRGYRLDLVVASHVDADHVMGLVALFQANGDASDPTVIDVTEVWHNSLRSLTGYAAVPPVTSRADEEVLAEIRSRGFPTTGSISPSEITARQGSSLAALLLKGGYRWNGGNGTRPIRGDGYPSTAISPSLQVTVIGPMANRLEVLRNWWTAEMRRLGFMGKAWLDTKFDDAFEFMTAQADCTAGHRLGEISDRATGTRALKVHVPDDSVVNGSSIAMILEHQSSRLLLLGDAWAEDTVISLRALNSKGKPLLFDAIKLAHHGSARNTSPELLDLVDSARYLVSTNGDQHKHPDIEVLKAIVDRPAGFRRELHFNYSTAASQFMKSYKSASGSEFSVFDRNDAWIQCGGTVQV